MAILKFFWRIFEQKSGFFSKGHTNPIDVQIFKDFYWVVGPKTMIG